MERDAFLDILDIPPELRTSEEAEALERHLAQHPEDRALVDAHELAFSGLEGAFALEPAPEVTARILGALPSVGEPAPAPSSASAGEAARGWWRFWERLPWPVLVPTLGLALLGALVALPLTQDPATEIRTKGDGVGAPEPLRGATTVDLQIAVESGGDTPTVRPGEERLVLGPDEALLFRCLFVGQGDVLLVERDPDHHLRVLHRWSDLSTGARAIPLDILGAEGQRLRYRPDGAPGEYTYLAVQTDPGAEVDSRSLDDIWGAWVEALRAPLGGGAVAAGLDGFHVRVLDPLAPAGGGEGRR